MKNPSPRTTLEAADLPASIALTADSVQWLTATAAKDGQPAAPKRFSMNAYNGGPMMVAGFQYPVVVDLAGMTVASKPKAFLEHDRNKRVGHIDAVNNDQKTLSVEGVVSASTQSATEVLADASAGFPWQASIGAKVLKHEFVPEGRSIQVNGQSFQGPINLVKKSFLGEVSFVALGADDSSSAQIAAHLEIEAMSKEKTPVEGAPSATEPAATVQATAAPVADPTAEIRAATAAEMKRISGINKVCAGKHTDLAAKAVEEGWDVTRTELEVLRASRPQAPAGHVPETAVTGGVLEAAVCLAGQIPNPVKHFGEQTVEAAGKRFRHGIGLQELLLEAAWANGFTGRSFKSDPDGVLRAGFSTLSLPGILSNIANKFLLAGFSSVENVWQRIAATRNVKDFKAVTSFRLTTGMEFEQVGPDGELKHGTVGEEKFTNQAKTHGRMYAATRQDIINDDLGALTVVPTRIGRGGATKLNKVFWTEFLDNAAFFTTGQGNYLAGATTVLSPDSLGVADQMFRDQKDGENNPLGIEPKLLLVPNALRAKGLGLMRSTEVRDTTASNKYPTTNIWADAYQLVTSAYLGNAAMTGYSAKAWYLLADPADLPLIEVAFLNGQQSPIVESAEADFSVLGIQFRGFFDFGVSKQDWRAGVKMRGEAEPQS